MRRPAFLATSVLLPACMLVGLIIVPTCSARVITVQFTATITEVSVLPPGGELTDDARLLARSFKVGDLVEGVYAYDTSAPDLSVHDSFGRYQFAARPCGVTLSTNGFIFKTDPEAVSVTVRTTRNNIAPIIEGLSGEVFGMTSKNNLMTPQNGDFRCQAISLDLGALWPNDPLNDDSLPISAPALESWDIRKLTFGVYHGQRPKEGWGSFESVAVEAVLTDAELLPDPAWVLYVDAGATPGGDGRSWPTAYARLQDALASAPTVGNTELRVAQGTYRPDQGAGIEPGDRDATFRLLNGVTIRGGYAGLGQPDPNAWDPALYEMVLWGDLEDNDNREDEATFYDNSEHIVTASGTNATAVLEGVTITRGACIAGFVRGGSGEPEGGVGLHNRSGSPTIRRCVFTQNLVVRARGAAMLNYAGAAPRLEECTFTQNYGRAVLCNQESSPTLSNCRFLENEGVAMGEIASNSQLDSCSFMDSWGSALTQESKSRTILSNCTFTGNYGAIQGEDISCTDCLFVSNRTAHGAGGVLTTTGEFVRCLFRDNSTGDTGGAIWAAAVILTDCQFIHNSAPSSGALACGEADIRGCLFAGNQADWMSPLWISSRCTLTNCTIVGNRSARLPIIDLRLAQAVLTNCIIWDNFCQNTRYGEVFYGGETTISYSCLKTLQHPVPGVGRIEADPCFANPGYWDPNGTPDDPNDDVWVDGDYHLKSQGGRWDPGSTGWVLDDVTSPCIDAGDPNSPVGDEPGPNGARVNMGAYGGTSEAGKSKLEEL